MFNYLGYALFVIIGTEKHYYQWCKNGGYRRHSLNEPIARDVYYLLKYLKDSKLPDNPYLDHLFDCRNAIAHWTDQRDYFRSFKKEDTLDRNEAKKPLLSVEEYLNDADELLELLYEDEEIFTLCEKRKKALKVSQQNIKILIKNFKMHKSYNGELRQSLDFAYHIIQIMQDYKEFALEKEDYNAVNVINELDWMVANYLRGENNSSEIHIFADDENKIDISQNLIAYEDSDSENSINAESIGSISEKDDDLLESQNLTPMFNE